MDKTPRGAGQPLDGTGVGKVTGPFTRIKKSGPASQGRFCILILEGQIVVGFLERAREILEVCSPRTTCSSLGACRGRRSAPSRTFGIVVPRRAAATSTEHRQLADVDLGRVAGLVLLVLPLTVLDAAFDVYFVALFAILLDDVGEARAFGVPHHAAVPLRLLLLLTIRRIPLPARRERECGDAIAARGRPHLWVAAQVSDQHHFVQTSAHCASWREFMSRPE